MIAGFADLPYGAARRPWSYRLGVFRIDSAVRGPLQPNVCLQVTSAGLSHITTRVHRMAYLAPNNRRG